MKPERRLAKRIRRLEDRHRRDMVALKAELLRAVHLIVEENTVARRLREVREERLP